MKLILPIFAHKNIAMIDIKKIKRSDALELLRVCKTREKCVLYRHYYISYDCTKEEANMYWNVCLNLIKYKNHGK